MRCKLENCTQDVVGFDDICPKHGGMTWAQFAPKLAFWACIQGTGYHGPGGDHFRQYFNDWLKTALEGAMPVARDQNKIIDMIRKFRIDAESPGRDSSEGITMLRSWLRRLHMDALGGWDQDTSQDAIAKLLGEFPRGHKRQFLVNPKLDR